MTTPYVGEIRMFGFNRIPTGWFSCDGSLKPIAQYEVLYALLGTTYGGDGQTTFGVPDLRGQLPMHQGNGQGLTPRVLGQGFGSETVTLNSNQMPQHNHAMVASQAQATATTPAATLLFGNVAGNTPADVWYFDPTQTPPTNVASLAATAIGQMGNSQPHDNCMPTETVSLCIAWAGVYPSQN